MAIEVRELSEQEFRTMQQPWQQLLAESDADPLFLSWSWQFSWWETWSQPLNLKLVLIAAFDGDRLVGLAPMYLDTVELIKRVKVRRLQFIGNAWRRASTVRTEYLGYISRSETCLPVVQALTDYMMRSVAWDELIICDCNSKSEIYGLTMELFQKAGCFVFDRAHDQGARITSVGSFEGYVNGLGKNTRLKLFNRRKYFESLGKVDIEYATTDSIDRYFDNLNSLHRTRWTKDCFEGKSLAFHKSLLKRLSSNQSMRFSSIRLDGEVISVLYNIRAGDTEYNLQAGFLEHVDKKVSLGTLHLGYSIESVFADPVISNFDLLAGRGKNVFYKGRLSDESTDFVTLQVINSIWLRWLYRIFFAAPPRIRRLLARKWLF